MALQFYRLAGHDIVPCSHEEWCRRFDRPEERRVARAEIGDRLLSTVFLGYDAAYGFSPPEFYETMLFSPDDAENNSAWRWATWAEAEAGHARIVARLEAGEEPEGHEVGEL